MTGHIEQPMPVRNDHPSIQALVRADLEQREQVGIQRYGTALQPHNGRDALRDLYEELLDGACYVKQAMVERDDYRELLHYIWLHVDWRFITGQLTTEQRELWADAVDAVSEALNPNDYGATADRWWWGEGEDEYAPNLAALAEKRRRYERTGGTLAERLAAVQDRQVDAEAAPFGEFRDARGKPWRQISTDPTLWWSPSDPRPLTLDEVLAEFGPLTAVPR